MKIEKKDICICVVIIIVIGIILLIHGFKKQNDNITQVNQDNLEQEPVISEENVNGLNPEPNISKKNVSKLDPEPNNNIILDESKITSILENVFAKKLKDLKGSPADYSVFFENYDTNRDAKYFVDKLTYIKALYEREGINKESMSIKLTFRI